MDILDSRDRGMSIFKLDISNRQLTVDRFNILLLGHSMSQLDFPCKLIAIAPAHRPTKTLAHRQTMMSHLELTK